MSVLIIPDWILFSKTLLVKIWSFAVALVLVTLKKMKTMCPPGYHHNGFVAAYGLGHMMYGYTLLVPMNRGVLNKLNKERNISGHK